MSADTVNRACRHHWRRPEYTVASPSWPGTKIASMYGNPTRETVTKNAAVNPSTISAMPISKAF